MFTLIPWDNIYSYLGIKDFIYFISSPSIQDALFPIKLVCIFFAVFFFIAIIWFYMNSSYTQYQFVQDTAEFFSNDTYGLRKINKSWKKIKKRIDSGVESELKIAIIEADDFLLETLEDMGHEGDTFEEILKNAKTKKSLNVEEILDAHAVRDAIVYESDYAMDSEAAKKILFVYETAIKNLTIE